MTTLPELCFRLEESSYVKRSPETSFSLLLEILDKLRTSDSEAERSDAGVNLYTRIAASALHRFANPKTVVSENIFEKFVARKMTLLSIFQNSGFKTPQPLVMLFGKQTPQGVTFDDANSFRKYFLLVPAEDFDPKILAALLQIEKSLFITASASLLSDLGNSKTIKKSLVATFFEASQVLNTLKFNDRTVELFPGLMKSVQALRKEERHRGAQKLLSLLQSWIETKKIRIPPAADTPVSQRSLCLVEKLQISDSEEVEPHTVESYKVSADADIIKLDPNPDDFKKLVGTILKAQPKAIAFETFGRSYVSFALSLLRLAPVQTASATPSISSEDMTKFFCIDKLADPNPDSVRATT